MAWALGVYAVLAALATAVLFALRAWALRQHRGCPRCAVADGAPHLPVLTQIPDGRQL